MNYVIKGKVVKGDGYGRKLGFPTINLESEQGGFPKEGVYAGTATLDGAKYRAGIVAGPRGKIEAHLLGYSGDAYGKKVMLETEKFLREYKSFDTEAELIIQIKKDLEQC